tara:strand:- start:18 stop:995 length:978 start_codon:yes stop_codon:yes gene_type:complete
MAQEVINIGVVANDGSGDTIRLAGTKINSNFTEVYAQPHLTLSHLSFSGNEIKGTQSNADIELRASGTGTISATEITIDSTINLTDNEIKVNDSNADLILTSSGSGSVVIAKADINSGAIDATVGGSTTSTGAFTTINMSEIASFDGVQILDNAVTSTSNADLQLSGAGTGTVSLNGIKFPTSDGDANQVLKTNGSGQLSFFTSPILFDVSDIVDGTATVSGASSAAQQIDSFSTSTFRSAKYHIQISDATDNRFRLIEANVTHDGSNAFISVFGGVDNGDGDGSSVYDTLDLSADINSGNVRLLGTVNNDNNQVVKFVRRPLKV